ncbi:metallophosphoesterase family protein [Terriglobus sp.]|uniref:metallophosphoesterase family protein n=1 Tax=Terriglobus sp. TaxID=1889013 RepID=UPI003B00D8EB
MRALILSDIHGNLEALEAVLAAAPPHDAVWNLGDVVGYGGSPNECVAVMRDRSDASVRGNHDKVCSGVMPATHFNPTARQAVEWTMGVLTTESRTWLEAMPQGPLSPPGSSSLISHGSPAGEDIYVLNIRDAWGTLQASEHRVTLFGHTHVQGGFHALGSQWLGFQPAHRNGSSKWILPLNTDGTRYMVNPGSVGQPRDGDWRAAFALLDEESNELTFYREPYDLARAQGRILMAGLPERLALRLREGR